MRNIFVALAFVIFITNVNIAKSAEPIFSIGAYADYNLSFHSADFKAISGCPNCSPGFTGGSGSGFSIGGVFELPINPKLRFDLRLGYTTMPANLREENIIGNTEVIDPITGNPKTITDAISEYVIESKFALFGVEPELVFYPIEKLRLSGLFRLGFLTNATFSQRETLLQPQDMIFKDTESKTRNQISDTAVPNAKTFQFQVGVGIGYELPLSKRARLIPEARLYYGLTNLSDESWKANGLQLGVTALWDIYPPKVKETIHKDIVNRDTTVKMIAGLTKSEVSVIDTKTFETTEETDDLIIITKTTNIKYENRVPKEVKLNVDFLTYGLYKDGTRTQNPTVKIEEIESSELFPLLPYVFFKEGSADINQSRLRLLNSEQAQKFTEKDLEWDIMNIYSNVLNIIAYRMKNRPNSDIIITGTNKNLANELNNTTLSLARANAVKKYLTDVWQIAPDRIKVQSRNLPLNMASSEYTEGQIENQRAEISSKDSEIIKSIELKDIVKSINPPAIEIVPEVISDAKIKNWQFNISQNAEMLRTYKGDGQVQKQEWTIANKPIPMTENKVDISLKVENEYGKSASKQKQVTIDQITIKEKRFEMKDDKRIERFSLILFDYDKAQLKPEHESVLKHIKSRIEPNSKVIISGYADKTGSAEYNKELASKRNAVVSKYLGLTPAQVVINNIGADVLLYDNNYPEGRNYCRTVIIVIETPIK